MISQMFSNLQGLLACAVKCHREERHARAFTEYVLLLEACRFYLQRGFGSEVNRIFGQLVAAQRSVADVMHLYALIRQSAEDPEGALNAMDMALLLDEERPQRHASRGRILLDQGRIVEAARSFSRALELDGNWGEAVDGLFVCDAELAMPGEDYYALLQRFHERLRPETYVEIGLGHGRSLALASPLTRAIGIDPEMAAAERLLYAAPQGNAALYQVTSDAFFATRQLDRELGKPTFDLAFIDGLHIFEQVLKDFIHLERYAGPQSVILVHDCLPISPLVAERERCSRFWTGDVWKVIPCLKTMRPDLEIRTIPAKPSGLAVITGLNPASTRLSQDFDRIVDYFVTLKLPETIRESWVMLNVAENSWPAIESRLSALPLSPGGRA